MEMTLSFSIGFRSLPLLRKENKKIETAARDHGLEAVIFGGCFRVQKSML